MRLRLLALLALLLGSWSMAAVEWDFTGKKNDGWEPTNGLRIAPTDNGLELTVTQDHPGLLLRKASFAPQGLDALVAVYTAEGTTVDRGGFLFFGTKTAPKLNEVSKYFTQAITADGHERLLVVDLHHERGAKPWYEAEEITSLRLDMVGPFRGKILLKKIAMVNKKELNRLQGIPEPDAREWVFNNTFAGWTGTRNLTATTTPEGLQLDINGSWPNISIRNMRLDPKGADYMAVTYKAQGLTSRTWGLMFFGTDTQPAFNEAAKFSIGTFISDGEEHTLYVAMSGVGTVPWREAKYISSIRFDMVSNDSGRILIKSIKYIEKDEYIKLKQAKYTKLGIPFTTEVTLPEKDLYVQRDATLDVEDRFTSKMAAPKGAFDYVGMNYIRVPFELKALPKANLLQSICDDQLEAVYLNGQKIAHEWSKMWSEMDSVELPQALFRVGANVLAIHYQNTGGVGGVMMDLQMTDAAGNCQVVAASDGVGMRKDVPEGWEKLDFAGDWAKVDVRPGPPNAPWKRVIPPYASLRAKDGIVNVTASVNDNDMTAKVTFRGEPAFKADDRFFFRIKNEKGITLTGMSGTLDDFGVKANADGSVTIDFSAYKEPLYGAPQKGLWEFGVFNRASQGEARKAFAFKGRVYPGTTAKLKVAQTAGGPVPMLNDKPFYFNALTNNHFTLKDAVPSGMEGKDSPMNIIVFRAGGSNPNSQWWLGPDTYDFSTIDRSMSEMLEWYPDSMMGLYVWCHPGHWYDKLYPERISKAHDGSVYGYYVSTVTFSNKDVQADAARAVAALVEHCEKYFGSRIVLYNLMGGISCEWQGWQAHSNKVADYSELATQDYIRYAAARGLKVSEVPTFEERQRAEWGIFRHPVKDAASILYERYYSDSIADCILAIADAVKRQCNNDKLVGCYYGYHQEYANLAHCVNGGGHNSLYKLLASPSIDFLLSPQSYGIRSLGAPNADMKPYGAIRAAGKFSILEDDVRTHLLPATGFDQTLNMKHTLAVFKRNQGMQLSRKMPLNQLPLVGGNELNAPEIREVFAKTLKAGQYLMEKGVSPVPEIAAVVDEDALKYLIVTHNKIGAERMSSYQYLHSGVMNESGISLQPISGDLLYYQRIPLAQIGATVDMIMLPDVAKLAGRYKLVIFLNSFADTPELREAVAALRRSGTKVLMTYGTGFIGKQGLDIEAMSRLAGMTLKRADKGSLRLKFADGSFYGNSYDTELRFAVADANAKVLASYSDNGGVAVAEKNGTIFYGGALLSSSFLRSVARECGVHIFCDSGDTVHAGAEVVTLHANHAGAKTVRLPHKADVVDVYSGEIVARNADTFTVEMEAFESRVFIYGQAETILRALK